MNLSPSSLGVATASNPALPGGSVAGALAKPGGFAGVWARAMPGANPAAEAREGQGRSVEVQPGDTLIGLVKAHYRQQGLPINESQAYRLAHQVAADNGIANPDLIVPGQQVDFARLQLPALARSPASASPYGAANSTAQALASRPWATPTPVPGNLSAESASFAKGATDQNHPVLDSTLARAVDKGFLPASDLGAVRERVLALADRYRFAPDDFARLTLMESGGMNPQASNGHCHGIIQFCDAALDIAGPQGSYLHVDRDRQKPITRDSIVQGLYAYTNQLLQSAHAVRRSNQQYAQTEGGTAP